MSYKISYGPMPKNTANKRKLDKRLPLFAIIIIMLALLARTFYPTQTKQLGEALFPLTSDSSSEALEVFSQHIEAGASVGEAVTAFCREIIYEGEIN